MVCYGGSPENILHGYDENKCVVYTFWCKKVSNILRLLFNSIIDLGVKVQKETATTNGLANQNQTDE